MTTENHYKKDSSYSKINNNLERVLNEKRLFLLLLLGVAAILIRLYYFPFNVPITLDGAAYFWYAIDLNILQSFPTNYNFPNTGWPTFLAFFFYFFRSENFLDYMNLQRLITMITSVLTLVPVYLLCTRFFDKATSLISSSLFIFDPRIIQNSLFGITEPLYIILGVMSLFLFLSNNYKSIYISFGLIAALALVRYEGLLLILPFTIMFFVRFRKFKKNLFRYLIALSIFLVVLLPMTHIRMETMGEDGVVSSVVAGPQYYQHVSESGNQGIWNFLNLLVTGSINLVKYLAWVAIPCFVFFVPYGIFKIFKNRDQKQTTIIIIAVVLLIPAFYGYSRDLQETRYLYALFPIFSIFSGYAITKLREKFNGKAFISILIVAGVLFASIMFLGIKEVDYQHESELFEIAQYLVNNANGVNDISPLSKYYASAILMDKNFPVLKGEVVVEEPKIISSDKFTSVDDYIKFGKDSGLTHLVVDGINNDDFLDDAFNNGKYPYLIKEFDSSEYDYNYHVKIFRIDYESFTSSLE